MKRQSSDLAVRLQECPIGRAFLLSIERDRVELAHALAPVQAYARAATIARALNPWSPGFDELLAVGRSRGAQLGGLAREIAAHPATRWWAEPLDPARQVLFRPATPAALHEPARTPDVEDARWEDYAERPVRWRITFTAHEGRSCIDAMIAAGVGDWLQGIPYRRLKARIGESARVLEILGPVDWHALCVSCPRINEDPASPAGAGTLVPDWRRLAERWDGVHLTFMGLLTVPFVRHCSASGSTMMWSWNTEGTIWLPGAPIEQQGVTAGDGHGQQSIDTHAE